MTISGLPINTNVLTSYTIVYRACDSRPTPNCATRSLVITITQMVIPIIALRGAATVSLFPAPSTVHFYLLLTPCRIPSL